MTAYELSILLHYATCADDYKGRGEPILAETLAAFVREGLLADAHPQCFKGGGRYRATDRLHVFAEALTTLPLPVWKMP